MRRIWLVFEVSIGHLSVLQLRNHAEGQEVEDSQGRPCSISTKRLFSFSEKLFWGDFISLHISQTRAPPLFFHGKVGKWTLSECQCKHRKVSKHFFFWVSNLEGVEFPTWTLADQI